MNPHHFFFFLSRRLRPCVAFLTLVFTFATVATSILAAPEPAPTDGSARNVVLVHGAFVDGSSYAGVIAILQKAGYHVTAVQNPLTSLEDDVAATRRALALQDGPTVLVGHSWGGVVISEAGNDPKVVGLVFLAALVPDVGELFSEIAQRFPAAPGSAHIQSRNGYARMDQDGFVANFAQDLPADQARVLAAVQGPIDATLFTHKTTVAAWKDKPSWYAVATQDRMLLPEMQRYLATRAKAQIVELDTSHACTLTRPAEVAKLIEAAAHGTR